MTGGSTRPLRAELVTLTGTAWQKGCLGSVDTRTTATLARLDDLASWTTRNTRDPLSGAVDGDGRADLLGLSASGEALRWIPNTTTTAGDVASRGSAALISPGNAPPEPMPGCTCRAAPSVTTTGGRSSRNADRRA